MNFRFLTLLTLLLFMVASGCRKSNNNAFPNVRVEEYVYLSNPSNFDLTAPGGWIYHTGGYRGLIVYRRYVNGNQTDFGAYDRACPEHYADGCSKLDVDEDGTYAVCGCNGEKYLLLDGSPTGGGQYPLMEYPTNFDGQVLYISN